MFILQVVVGSENLTKTTKDPRLVSCVLGSIKFKILIDTGAAVNTITYPLWLKIKKDCHTIIQDLTLFPEEILKGYASDQPLKVECSFNAYIRVDGENQKMFLTKFFVVHGTDLPLMSYKTARNLNLIRIGSNEKNINQVDLSEKQFEEFPKIPIEGVKFRIDETVIPKQIIRYNIPKAYEAATNKRLREMEAKGIIERADKAEHKVTSVSPLMLVPKGMNDFRIVVDYREVNKSIIREPYPMPSLERIWTEIPNDGGQLYMTKLDLSDAFFHIELHETVRHLTTFMTANGLMRFKRLPFGLSIAPELFQKTMERILINCKNVIVYLDDILIYATSAEELLQMVEKVKRVLNKNNLTINEAKSLYNQQKVEFLGFIIDGSGILPMSKKITDISSFKRPSNVHELRSFLGLMTFISPFIKDFSTLTKPLRDLLTEKKFVWAAYQQSAFNQLKVAAESGLVKRGYFDENDETILYTDASPFGLGAVLTQTNKSTNCSRVIACASKSLTPAESRYAQLHREALAIVWGMERFNYYLLGRKFTLMCDNNALGFMIKKKDHKDSGKRVMSRAEGWFLRLEHYDFTFVHVEGKENISDAPSRLVPEDHGNEFEKDKPQMELCSVEVNTERICEVHLALTNKKVRQTVEKDEELQEVMNCMKNGKEVWPEKLRRYQAFSDKLYEIDGLLMKEEKMVLPASLRAQAIKLAHFSHPGMTTMKFLLRQGVWWPGIDKDIEDFVKSCPECQLITPSQNPLPISHKNLPKNVWEHISMDFSTASLTSDWKALVLTDHYSRFLVAVPMTKTDTEAVKKVLKRVLQTYYVPKTILADNGPPFNSEELKRWLYEEWGIELQSATPLNPTENGLCERSMSGINKMTVIAKLDKKNWNEALSDYVAAYNTWPHHVTKIPPAELMFGRIIRHILPNAKNDERQNIDEELRDRDQEDKFKRNTRENFKRHAKETELKVGDKVLVQQEKREKADTIFKNVFHKILKFTGSGRVTIQDLESGRIFDRNVKHLKKYVDRENRDDGTGIDQNICLIKFLFILIFVSFF